MARFEGKSVVIIGGNSGIGRAAAEAFAAEGAQISLAGRDKATLAETQAVLGGDGRLEAGGTVGRLQIVGRQTAGSLKLV